MTARRPSILVLTPYPLLPANSGGRLYALSVVAPVAAECDLHLLALANPAEREEIARGGEELRREYGRIFKTFAFEERPLIPLELRSRLRRLRILRHFAVHLRYGLPLMDLSYYQPRTVARARSIVREQRIDAIEIHHLHCAFYRRFLPDVPAVLVNHNIESDLWPFWPLGHGWPAERWLWDRFGERSRAYAKAIEIDNAFRFDAKTFVSPGDMERVPEGTAKRFLLPMSVTPDATPKRFSPDRFVMLWIGGFFWPPNVDAVGWFMAEIWPLVRAAAKVPVEVHFVGVDPPETLRAQHDDREVFVHGYVDDAAAFRAKADALIVPLRAGGGVRVKIIEALNAGVPVVTTSKGCEGLPVVPGRDLLLADEPAAFAAALVEIMGSVERRERLSRAARDYCAANHSPAVVAAKKRVVYEAALHESTPSAEARPVAARRSA